MATHVLEKTETFSLWKFAVGGVIAGILAGIVNNLFIVLFPFITPYQPTPGIDTMSVTIFSFLPVLAASLIYFGLYSINSLKGTRNYIILGIGVLMLSFYGPLFPESIMAFIESMNIDYSFITTEGFAYFLIPMHLITAFMALYVVPKFVTARDN
jgi:hypothetical protein